MSKAIVSWLVLAGLVIAFTGCGGSDDAPPPVQDTAGQALPQLPDEPAANQTGTRTSSRPATPPVRPARTPPTTLPALPEEPEPTLVAAHTVTAETIEAAQNWEEAVAAQVALFQEGLQQLRAIQTVDDAWANRGRLAEHRQLLAHLGERYSQMAAGSQPDSQRAAAIGEQFGDLFSDYSTELMRVTQLEVDAMNLHEVEE